MKLAFIGCIIVRILLAPIIPEQIQDDDSSWSYSELICDQCEKDLDGVDRYYSLSCGHILCVKCFNYQSYIDPHCPACGMSFLYVQPTIQSDLFEL